MNDAEYYKDKEIIQQINEVLRTLSNEQLELAYQFILGMTLGR